MKIEVFQSRERAEEAAAEVVARRLREVPDPVLMMPTGRTMTPVYQRLVELYRRDEVSFAKSRVFNLDEYLGLGAGDPASFASYMRENLFRHVDAVPGGTRIPDGKTKDPERECEDYEAEIEASGGPDLCLLGIGKNGHVGFNEPGTPFSSRTRVVDLSDSTRRVNGEDFPEGLSPARALTAGIQTILRSREIVLLATGIAKARAVAAAVEGPRREEVPASALQAHPACTFIVDTEAAGLLEESR